MKKEWLWGPGRIDPEFKSLTRQKHQLTVAESYGQFAFQVAVPVKLTGQM